jgi:cell shape-determining protein MreC
VAVNQSEIGLLSQESGPTILAKTESGVQGLIRGDGKRVLLTEIPVDVTLNVGERIVTQGQEGVAPNMFIGRISAVRNDPASAVQTALIEQLVSFYEASIVEVR